MENFLMAGVLISVVTIVAGSLVTVATKRNFLSAGLVPLGAVYVVATVCAVTDPETSYGFAIPFLVFAVIVFIVACLASVVLRKVSTIENGG